MKHFDRENWIALLRSCAGDAPDPSEGFGLDDIEAPFRRALGLAPRSTPGISPKGPSAEARVWAARCDPSLDISTLIDSTADGPLLSVDRYRAIEVWTDAELSALHALWWIAGGQDGRDWHARLKRAASWHLEFTQPDNATNRPWALHVFALDERPEAQHYAQTLLHNAMAQDGRPSALAAWILEDAARAIAQARAQATAPKPP